MEKYIDKLAWIFVEDGKFLTTLSRGKDTWYIPGGKREEGESDVEALVREIKEELSVDLVEESIRRYGVFEAQAHGKNEGVVVKMTCFTADYSGEMKPDNEVEKLAFMGYDGREVSSPVDRIIIEDMRERGLIS